MKIIVGLIKGRHEMPVDDYIFESVENIFDFTTIANTISAFLQNIVGIKTIYGSCLNQNDYTDIQMFTGCNELVVYVTGLTAVTAELIRLCALNGISLTLMHYNNATNEYVAQKIF